MIASSLVTLLIPVWILAGLVIVLGVLALLGRVQGGRYLRPVFAGLAKVPILRGWLQKASQAAIERSNPELASAMRKMQRSGAMRDPMKAQAAMSQLSRDERRALMEMQEQQQDQLPPESLNRQARRRMERAQRKLR